MPSKMQDLHYLKDNQYKNQVSLNARIRLHQQFTIAEEEWFAWVWRHVNPQPGERILEVGCGTGEFWRKNRSQIPAGLCATLVDLSYGMVQDARGNIQSLSGLQVLNANIEGLPLPAAAFSKIMANHMLYHVPNLPLGLQELRRVLQPGGRLIATTTGPAHMRELYAVLQTTQGYPSPELAEPLAFNLQTGSACLAPFFTKVDLNRYASQLWVADPQAVVDYCASMIRRAPGSIETLERITSQVEQVIAHEGGFFIQKELGLLLAQAE